jgi:hypothetical protein
MAIYSRNDIENNTNGQNGVVIDVPRQVETVEQKLLTDKVCEKLTAIFTTLVLPIFTAIGCIYYFWLGGTAASITVHSRNAYDGIQNIDHFPGRFYKYLVGIATIGIFMGFVLACGTITILVKNCKKKNLRNTYWLVGIAAVVFGTIMFVLAAVVYANYIDLGQEYVETKYDMYDSRYSSFIAAQLTTIIINAPLALIGSVSLAIIIAIKINELFCLD